MFKGLIQLRSILALAVFSLLGSFVGCGFAFLIPNIPVSLSGSSPWDLVLHVLAWLHYPADLVVNILPSWCNKWPRVTGIVVIIGQWTLVGLCVGVVWLWIERRRSPRD